MTAAQQSQRTLPVHLVHSPLIGDVTRLTASSTMTLAEIIASVPGLPDQFHRTGQVLIARAGQVSEVPRKFWARGQVKARLWLTGSDEEPVLIRLVMAPGRTGGGKGVKSVVAIVATIALLAVGAFITGGALAPLLGAGFAAGSFGAQAAAFAVTFLGRLAISMATKPAAQPKDTGAQGPALGQAGASGNMLQPGGAALRVCGRMKVFPQLACYPLVELVDNDELVEAAYRLSGPHELRNITVEDAPYTEVDGLSLIYNEGTEVTPQRLVQRYGFQVTPQSELKAHRRSTDNPTRLSDEAFPENCLPKPYILTTKADPDRIWLQLLWPSGWGETDTPAYCQFHLRIKMAIAGTSNYINLPELAFRGNIATARVSKMVEITWDQVPSSIVDQAFDNGAWAAWHTALANGSSPVGAGGWNSHASFRKSATYNDVARVERRADRFVIYLDPAVFPRGQRWKVWMMRGSLTPNNFVASTYLFSGSSMPVSPFHYRDSGPQRMVYYAYTPRTVESCILMRVASVWNRSPLPLTGDATIEVRGRNINITQLSCTAGALVKRWDGVAFNDLGASSNPADHLYDALTGAQTADPVPSRLINLPALGAWHADNLANGRQIAAVFDGREWRETMNTIAAAGLAKVSEGRLWSVVRQRNTSTLGLPPAMVFTHLNTVNFRFSNPMTRVPDAVRVSFLNRDLDWEEDEMLVMRPGLTNAEANYIVSLRAAGIDQPTQIASYYRLYLAATDRRNVFFTFETWFECLGLEEGDIVGINHLLLTTAHQSARIVEVERNGANEVTAVTIDVVPDANDSDGLEQQLDLKPIADMAAAGQLLGAVILTGQGVVAHPVTDISDETKRVVFSTPFVNNDVLPGQMMLLGTRGEEYMRCEVTKIEVIDELMFRVTCVPEAPEMWEGV